MSSDATKYNCATHPTQINQESLQKDIRGSLCTSSIGNLLWVGSPSRYVEFAFRIKVLYRNVTRDVNKTFVKKK